MFWGLISLWEQLVFYIYIFLSLYYNLINIINVKILTLIILDFPLTHFYLFDRVTSPRGHRSRILRAASRSCRCNRKISCSLSMRGVKVIGLFNLCHAVRRTGRALWLSLQEAETGRAGWKNPRTLCFVACLVTSNNRLALKSPGPRPTDFFFFYRTLLKLSFDAQISVPVLTGCEPMKHFIPWSKQKRSETLAKLTVAPANCQRGSEERKKWHLGGKRGAVWKTMSADCVSWAS